MGGAEIILVVVNVSIVQVACREEEANYIKNKRKLERAKKRQEKKDY